MIDEVRPQRITWLESTLVWDIQVSSIHYHVFTDPRPFEETCVFFTRDHHSEVVGRYDDHDSVVEEMKQKHNATVKS